MKPESTETRHPALPGRIRVLTPDVSNKIAAGEVIERPASVVKELVENAIDARARSVRIEVLGGGRELIRITDDGAGVAAEDAPLAFQRHATSKISSALDLTTVRTLGFRGEALPSIASVARVEFVSRTAASDAGVRLTVEGGETHLTPWGAPVGTQITVRDLFYNTPARYKFLKTDGTERRHIAEYVTHMALARPDVRFELFLERRLVLQSPGNDLLKEAIASVYGKRVIPDLIPVAWESPWASISGYVGKPTLAKGNRSAESLFVNGRWIQSRLLNVAVERGYEALLAHRKFPLVVLHIAVDPTLIDVNVHPAKTEIRFKDDRETFKAVMLAVRKALTEGDLVPGSIKGATPDGHASGASGRGEGAGESPAVGDSLPLDWRSARHGSRDEGATREPEWFGEGRGVYDGAVRNHQAVSSAGLTVDADGDVPLAVDAPDELVSLEAPAKAAHAGERLALSEAEAARAERAAAYDREGVDVRQVLRTARVVAQIALTYLLVPAPTGLWVIDQHVAHERILFERVLRAKRSERPAVQELLVPHPLALTPRQAAAVEDYLDELLGLGFVLERFGPKDFALRGVPSTLAKGAGAQFEILLEELIGVMQEGGPSTLERTAATVACRAAVKAGDPLPIVAAERLVRDLAEVENPFACPHGRPVVIELSVREFERRFGRT